MQHPASGKLVTIFGGSGFVGTQVVRRLARDGFRIRVVTRNPNLHLELKPLGEVGQIALVRGDVRDPAQVRNAVRGAAYVVNLVGILRPGGGQSFEAIHAAGPDAVAQACAAEGVEGLVQMSAIGADPNSNSAYSRSRAEGEAATRAAFPSAVVLRPSVVFGTGDGFFNLFARLMRFTRVFFPSFGGGRTKFQPVYVGDVADAVSIALRTPAHRGRIFELGGPAVMSLQEILDLIARETGRSFIYLPVPFFLLDIMSLLTGWLPFAPMTYDQAKLLRKDNVVKVGADAARVGTFADLGITPTPAEAIVESYLYAYRPTGQYAGTGPA
ncbi:MAG: complex I NDUFA9 subunit family protein [Alphaproteobacteria bacterium]|nr:complex I NDUFA9 subunit family protein [Alphaproteobacteria bacterium]